jgi:threonine synthase
MQFYSTNNLVLTASFEQALITGMAPDGGLYMPENIPKFTSEEILKLQDKSLADIAFEIAQKFLGNEIPAEKLREICNDAYDFVVPLHKLSSDNYVLELFHGPTLAFKDFAARFMARCADYFLSKNSEKKTILVATSGDTGGAIGNGFLGMNQINVVILYPKGGVSPMQEKQLTTMGQNISTLEIDGNFDDCQQLVKQAFVDKNFAKFKLMSANSINIGRIIPQSFYWAWTSLQINSKNLVISVPSGNFGNLFGAIIAKKMGFPIKHFIAANNANHPFFDYLKTGELIPVPSVQTLSNAMDIGHPNNYYRINNLFNSDVSKVREIITAFHYSDDQTKEKMREIYNQYDYIMCPHTAVAQLGIDEFKQSKSRDNLEVNIYITASTAHPAKFVESVEEILDTKLNIPASLKTAFKKQKQTTEIKPSLVNLKNYLEKL